MSASPRGPDFWRPYVSQCFCGNDWNPPFDYSDGSIKAVLCPKCTDIVFPRGFAAVTKAKKTKEQQA